MTFTGPLKQREQDGGGRKASRVGRIAWSAQSRHCVGYQDNRLEVETALQQEQIKEAVEMPP